MANKLLNTVYDLNKQITELKNGCSTILESLLNNPDIGGLKFQEYDNVLEDAKLGYPTLREKILSIDDKYNDLLIRFNEITLEDVLSLKQSINDAKGTFDTLKEALENSGVDINVSYNNDTTKLVIANNNSVESDVYTIPTNKSVVFKTDQLIQSGLFDVLIRDMYPNKTIIYDMDNEDTLYSDVTIDKLVDTYFALKSISTDSIFDLTSGYYYQTTNYSEYDVTGKGFVFSNSAPFTSATKLDKLFKPYASKVAGEFYKTSSTSTISNLFIVLDNPIYLTKLRIYPFTSENTTNTISVLVYDELGNNIKTYPVTTVNQSSIGAYFDITLGTMCKSFAITLGVNNSNAYKYLNTLEFYTTPTVVNSDTIETEPKQTTIYDLKYMTSTVATTNVDYRFNNILWFLKNNMKTYMYKPKSYIVQWDAFVDKTGRPCIYSGVKSYIDFFNFTGFVGNSGVKARISARLSHDTWYAAKICVRGWDKNINFKATTQTYEVGIKYLLSFDEGVTYWYYKGTTWGQCSINDINIYGMERSDLLVIPKEEMAKKLNNFLVIAVRSMNDTNIFSNVTLDTNDDRYIEVTNENDLKYCAANRIANLPNITPGSFVTLDNGSYQLNLSFRFMLLKDNLSYTPKIKDLSINVNTRYYWRNLNNYDLDNVKINYYEGYAEVSNKYTTDITVKVNTIIPKETVVLDKNTGTNLTNMSNLISQYKEDSSFISNIVASAKKSLAVDEYIIDEAALANTKLLLMLYCKTNTDYYGEKLVINSLQSNSLTVISDASSTYSVGKYTLQASATASYVVTNMVGVTVEAISAIRVFDYCDRDPEKIFIILNEEQEIEIFNNEITLDEIKKVYNKIVNIVRFKFQYRSPKGSAASYNFYGFSTMFLDRKYILDNNRVKINIELNDEKVFTIPFYKEHEPYIKVYVNDVPQVKDKDYTLDFTGEPKLIWISPDFGLEIEDDLIIEVITQ